MLGVLCGVISQPSGAAPILSGSGRVGESILSTSSGQWSLDGTPISGATGRAYTPGTSDVGKVLTQTPSGGSAATVGQIAGHIFFDDFTVASDTVITSYTSSAGTKYKRALNTDTPIVSVLASSGRVKSSSSTGSTIIIMATSPANLTRNYRVSTNIFWVNPSIGGVVGQCETNGASKRCYAFFYSNVSNTWVIERYNISGSTPTHIAFSSTGVSAPVAGQTQNVALEVITASGTTTVTGKVDGVTVCTGSEASTTIAITGLPGLFVGRADAEFLDFKVESLETILPSVTGVQTTIGDGIWSWFNNPNQVSKDGDVLTGSVSSAGNIYVGINHNGFSHYVDLGSIPSRDDHNNPSIDILPSGRIIVVASSHNGGIYGWVSTNPFPDISLWGARFTINDGTQPDVNSYSNISVMPDGFVRVIGRQGPGGVATNQQWLYKKSVSSIESGDTTWAAPVPFMGATGNRPYPVYAVDQPNGRIDIFMSGAHPNEDVCPLLHCYVICSGGNETFFKSDGTQITATLPFDPNVECTLVQDVTGGQNWSWSIQRQGTTLYASSTKYPGFTSAIARGTILNNIEYWTHRFTPGTGWESFRISTGQKSLYAQENCYAGGVYCYGPDPTQVFVAEKNASGFNEIVQYKVNWGPPGTGASGKSLIANLTPNSTWDNHRPFSVAAGHNRSIVTFFSTELSGDYTTYTSYHTRIKSAPLQL